MNHTKHRLTPFNQRNIDCEFAVSLDKLLRPIQRIDQPQARPRQPLVGVQSDRFFRYQWNFRGQRVKPVTDEVMSIPIGSGQRRPVCLFLYIVHRADSYTIIISRPASTAIRVISLSNAFSAIFVGQRLMRQVGC